MCIRFKLCQRLCCISCLVCVGVHCGFTQELERLFVPFYIQGQALQMPQVGGLNNPQYSAADLNADGLEDLYVFDYAAKKHLAFTWENGIWTWQESLTQYFPELESWAMLRDFDQDGATDIFAYAFEGNNPGLIVYKGYWSNALLQFEPYLFSEYQFKQAVYPNSDFYNFIYITAGEIPAIGDADGDGDIDILTYGTGAGYLDFYKNMSVEQGFGLDSLLFMQDHHCWGGFFESGSGIVLSDIAGECASRNGNEKRHGNSTLSLLDYDGNGLQDLLVSDLSTPLVSLLLNNGTNALAHITQQENNFPAYDIPISIQYTPFLSIVDADKDGKKDILVSPQLPISENVKVTHFYKNTGENVMQLEFQDDHFLSDEMIDFGTDTHPAIADVNGDGLLDLVIGNYGYFIAGGDRDARLLLCLNIGTATEAAFELTNDDWLNLSSLNDWLFTPTFADLDSDGDLDLVFGTALGTFYYGENIAAANEAMRFEEITANWMGLHSSDFPIGQRSTPHFADIDKDGLLDLITGESQGNVNYFRNIGTPSVPLFNPDTRAAGNSNFFGGLDARIVGSLQGYSAPYLLPTKDDTQILLASQEAGVLHYTDIENEQFTALDQPFLSNKYGQNLHIAAADLNNDSYIDIVCGHQRGGLSFFTSGWEVAQDSVMTNSEFITRVDDSFQVFAMQNHIYIQSKITAYQVQVFDSTGRLMAFQENAQVIPTANWSAALYLLRITSEQGIFLEKILVMIKQ